MKGFAAAIEEAERVAKGSGGARALRGERDADDPAGDREHADDRPDEAHPEPRLGHPVAPRRDALVDAALALHPEDPGEDRAREVDEEQDPDPGHEEEHADEAEHERR